MGGSMGMAVGAAFVAGAEQALKIGHDDAQSRFQCPLGIRVRLPVHLLVPVHCAVPLRLRVRGAVGTVVGVFGMVPTAMFAVFGLLTPVLVRRLGLEHVALLSMVLAPRLAWKCSH